MDRLRDFAARSRRHKPSSLFSLPVSLSRRNLAKQRSANPLGGGGGDSDDGHGGGVGGSSSSSIPRGVTMPVIRDTLQEETFAGSDELSEPEAEVTLTKTQAQAVVDVADKRADSNLVTANNANKCVLRVDASTQTDSTIFDLAFQLPPMPTTPPKLKIEMDAAKFAEAIAGDKKKESESLQPQQQQQQQKPQQETFLNEAPAADTATTAAASDKHENMTQEQKERQCKERLKVLLDKAADTTTTADTPTAAANDKHETMPTQQQQQLERQRKEHLKILLDKAAATISAEETATAGAAGDKLESEAQQQQQHDHQTAEDLLDEMVADATAAANDKRKRKRKQAKKKKQAQQQQQPGTLLDEAPLNEVAPIDDNNNMTTDTAAEPSATASASDKDKDAEAQRTRRAEKAARRALAAQRAAELKEQEVKDSDERLRIMREALDNGQAAVQKALEITRSVLSGECDTVGPPTAGTSAIVEVELGKVRDKLRMTLRSMEERKEFVQQWDAQMNNNFLSGLQAIYELNMKMYHCPQITEGVGAVAAYFRHADFDPAYLPLLSVHRDPKELLHSLAEESHQAAAKHTANFYRRLATQAPSTKQQQQQQRQRKQAQAQAQAQAQPEPEPSLAEKNKDGEYDCALAAANAVAAVGASGAPGAPGAPGARRLCTGHCLCITCNFFAMLERHPNPTDEMMEQAYLHSIEGIDSICQGFIDNKTVMPNGTKDSLLMMSQAILEGNKKINSIEVSQKLRTAAIKLGNVMQHVHEPSI